MFNVKLPILVESMYSVQAYGIHADFSLGTRVFQEIEEALQGYEIGILGIVVIRTPLNTHEIALLFQPMCYQFKNFQCGLLLLKLRG